MSSTATLSPQEMRAAALCTALATATTVMVLEFFRIPNCYMSLTLAVTLSVLPRPTLSHVIARVVALSLGILTSMGVLIAFFQAPWLSLPLAASIPALGYAFFLKRFGPGSAYAFGAYFLAFYIMSNLSLKESDFVLQALKLWIQSIIPIVLTYLAAMLTKQIKPTAAYAKIDLAGIVSIALTVSIAIMLDIAIKTDRAARLVMASISTITFLEIGKSVNLYLQQMIGYFCGAIVATAFIVGVVALGNDISLYLLALGGLFGLLEWLGCYFSNHTTFFRGIISMCSFSVLMIPTPDRTFHVAYGRITTSLLGFFTAIFVYLIIQEFRKLTERLMTPARLEAEG